MPIAPEVCADLHFVFTFLCTESSTRNSPQWYAIKRRSYKSLSTSWHRRMRRAMRRKYMLDWGNSLKVLNTLKEVEKKGLKTTTDSSTSRRFRACSKPATMPTRLMAASMQWVGMRSISTLHWKTFWTRFDWMKRALLCLIFLGEISQRCLALSQACRPCWGARILRTY